MTDIPKTGFPVIDIAVVVVIALSVASPFAVKTYRAIQELRKDMLSVKHQVKNDHGSNLRDDLDKTTEITREGWKAVQVTLADIQDKLKNVALDFGGLRSEMRHERDKTDDINKRVHALEMKTEVAKQVKAEVGPTHRHKYHRHRKKRRRAGTTDPHLRIRKQPRQGENAWQRPA